MERRGDLILFDPADPPPAAWPAGRSVERGYLEGIARLGPAGAVGNVRTRWHALRLGEHVLPVTVNDGEVGDSYVCLPHSAYALYARVEIRLVGASRWLGAVIGPAGALLRAAGINRIVNVDNWLLSTNLHGGWTGERIADARRLLAERFPNHLIAVRSVDRWTSPALYDALASDGWTMLPARQIWATDDLHCDWLPRRDCRNDRRQLRRSRLAAETLTAIGDAEAERIADLYHQLYVGKYSALNPVFTPAFVRLSHAIGLIRYHVARDADGAILAVAGVLARGAVATTPVVGYDMSRPAGLYRIACLLASEDALARGLRLHGSAGAGAFKRLRGAHGVIEYWAMHTAHLPRHRRLAVTALAAGLERWAVPMMRARGW